MVVVLTGGAWVAFSLTDVVGPVACDTGFLGHINEWPINRTGSQIILGAERKQIHPILFLRHIPIHPTCSFEIIFV